MGDLTPIDHDELIKDNTATEYSESEVLTYTQALNNGHTELDELFIELIGRLDFATVTGESLDIIGRIVGQSRIVVGPSTDLFFGFDTIPESNPFGDETDPSVGGRFRDDSEPTTSPRTLIDSEYRVFIQAKIFKNHTLSTPEETIRIFSIIFGISPIILDDAFPSTGFARIIFTRFLNEIEKALLSNPSLLPKTAGVSYSFAEVNIPFGFLGGPGVEGFADEATPLVGGSFPRDIIL